METTFDTTSDQMPKQGALDIKRRKKLIYSVGLKKKKTKI